MNAPVTEPEIMECADDATCEIMTWQRDQIRKYNAFGLTVYAHCKSTVSSPDGFYAELAVCAFDDEITDEVYDIRDVERCAHVMAGRLVLRAIHKGLARAVEVTA